MKVRFIYSGKLASAYPYQWDLEVNNELTGAYIVYSSKGISYSVNWSSIMSLYVFDTLAEAKYVCINMGLINKRFVAT